MPPQFVGGFLFGANNSCNHRFHLWPAPSTIRRLCAARDECVLAVIPGGFKPGKAWKIDLNGYSRDGASCVWIWRCRRRLYPWLGK